VGRSGLLLLDDPRGWSWGALTLAGAAIVGAALLVLRRWRFRRPAALVIAFAAMLANTVIVMSLPGWIWP
jgi:hypothetical protein